MGDLIFISGFPGSRTAWVSVALSLAGMPTGHESAQDAGTLLNLMTLRGRRAECSGFLPLFWKELDHATGGRYRRIHLCRKESEAFSSVKRRYAAERLDETFSDIRTATEEWDFWHPPTRIDCARLAEHEEQRKLCQAAGLRHDEHLWSHIAQYQVIRRP